MCTFSGAPFVEFDDALLKTTLFLLQFSHSLTAANQKAGIHLSRTEFNINSSATGLTFPIIQNSQTLVLQLGYFLKPWLTIAHASNQQHQNNLRNTKENLPLSTLFGGL
jgi:hypothetical protein